MSRLTRFGSLALTLFVLSTAALMAKERPHKFRGEGQFAANQIDFTGSGVATHLGKFTEVGNITSIVPGGEPGVFLVTAESTFTTDEGEELHERIDGQLNFLTGVGTATITYDGGSGRFVNATGTATLQLQLAPDGSFTYKGEGAIDY
jgi:hypothetical protein